MVCKDLVKHILTRIKKKPKLFAHYLVSLEYYFFFNDTISGLLTLQFISPVVLHFFSKFAFTFFLLLCMHSFSFSYLEILVLI